MLLHSLLLSISTKVIARFNNPIQQMNLYQQYNIFSQHMYSRRGLEFNLGLGCTI